MQLLIHALTSTWFHKTAVEITAQISNYILLNTMDVITNARSMPDSTLGDPC